MRACLPWLTTASGRRLYWYPLPQRLPGTQPTNQPLNSCKNKMRATWCCSSCWRCLYYYLHYYYYFFVGLLKTSCYLLYYFNHHHSTTHYYSKLFRSTATYYYIHTYYVLAFVYFKVVKRNHKKLVKLLSWKSVSPPLLCTTVLLLGCFFWCPQLFSA